MGAVLSPLVSFPAGASMDFPLPAEVVSQDGADQGPERVSVRLLDQKHPDYALKLDCWVDLAILHEGGAALRKGSDRILRKRPREDQDVYSARRTGFTYQNILGTALGWYGAAMFGEDPEFFFNGKKAGSADSTMASGSYYDRFLGNCDGNGKSYIDFFKKIFSTILVYGGAWVLTDLDAVPGDQPPPKTLQEQDDRGLRDPHLVLYTPMNVLNYQEDAKGVLDWAVVKVTSQKQEFLKRPEVVDTWYCYDREMFKVYEDRRPVEQAIVPQGGAGRMANLVGSGRHALANEGRVPLRRMVLDDGLWLANRVYLLLLNHVNQDNSLDWALFMSNLAVPVIIGDVDTTNLTTSEAGFYQFPSGTTYGWSEPEGKSFDQSARRLESLREEAFRGMHLQAQGRSMHATPAMQSGRSKIMEMVPAHEVLSAMGRSLGAHMQAQLGDVAAARGDSVVPDVRGFNFDDDMTAEEVFAVASMLNLKIPSKRFEKYMYKKVAKSWMRNANHDQVTAVYDEIEQGPTADERADAALKERIKLIQAGLAKALQQVDSPGLVKAQAGGGPPPTSGTPGQGGGGSKPPAESDISAGYVGQ